MQQRRVHGPAIKAIRLALGIPAGVLAVRAGVSAGYLSHVEKGTKQPSPAVARKLADELGYGLDAITYVVPELVAA